ncbi:MAG TPA: serine/threonine-protein kinase [Herpetosiphonaceae bacterium]|nr:serine/threonine-protein kinase [Herpetosiphonaceae bacterium]
MDDPLIGQQLGPYLIQTLLGRGGMAQVYEATDTALGRPVALKLLAPALRQQTTIADRMLQEGRVLASFQHPGIVQIYNLGTYQGLPYLVQELLPGPTLEEEISAATSAGQRIDRATVLALISAIASALDYAHQRGVIHRDLKPSNLMRNAYGQMVLMDFGIAKGVTGTEKLTQTGMVLGTPHYLAPEQAQGGALTPAVDIYALGIILYELLTGAVPFDDPTPLVVALAHIQRPPPPLAPQRPDLPPAVIDVMDRALAKDPAVRFPTAGDLAAALTAAWSDADQAVPTPAADIHTKPTTVNPAVRLPDDPYQTVSIHRHPTVAEPALAAQAAVRPPAPLPPPPAATTRPVTQPLGRAWTERAPSVLRDRRVLAGLLAVVGILVVVLLTRNTAFDEAVRRVQTMQGAPGTADPDATAAARAPAAPDLAGPVLIADAFTAAPWYTQDAPEGRITATDGQYQLTMPPGTNTLWVLPPRGVTIPSDQVAVAVTIDPRQGAAGLVFGFRGLNDHHRLVTTADGAWRIEQRQGRSVTVLASGTGAGKGRLGLVVRGAAVRAYAGDTLLHELTLPAAPGGSLGVILVTPDAGDVVFESLVVRAAP